MEDKNRKQNGYTLIEVLVSIAMFFIFVAGPTGFFIMSLKGQIKTLASRELVDSTSYALEYVSRALRMARKDLSGRCLEITTNYEDPSHPQKGETIQFLNYQDFCQEFTKGGVELKTQKSTDDSDANFGPSLSLTSGNLKINKAKFKMSGETQNDDLQPRVTVILEILTKTQPETRIRVQTTISQRNLDVTY